ncbi:MAG: hypothetical protein HQM10_12175 [Candidatus Riflebacteria bacterium]|nr:hypothetical protein [Candidatus Riflebacteria bacterium]
MKEFKYYSIVKQSINEYRIPFNVSEGLRETKAGGELTNRFWAIPETLSVFSPQAVFLKFFSEKAFIIFNTMLLFSVGFYGMLSLAAYLNWTHASVLMFYLLFNFNGYITSHFAVGHSMWSGYFLLPYFFLELFFIASGKATFTSVFSLAFVNLMILLQGSLHIFVFCMLYMGVCLFSFRFGKWQVFSAIIYSVLFSLFRLLPAAKTFEGLGFLTGYPDIFAMLKSLVLLLPWNAPREGLGYIGHWELDYFFGIFAFSFLLIFGLQKIFKLIYMEFRSESSVIAAEKASEISSEILFVHLVPALILLVLSYDRMYFYCFFSPWMGFAGVERITTRIIVMPVTFLIITAVTHFSEKMKAIKSVVQERLLPFIIAVSLITIDLFVHSYIWRMKILERAFTGVPDPGPPPVIIFSDDEFYLNICIVSIIFSATTFLFALMKLYVISRNEKYATHKPKTSETNSPKNYLFE